MKIKNIVFVIFLSLLFNFIFNFRLFKELTITSDYSFADDSIVTEYLIEQSRQNILHKKSPFITQGNILYPFQTNYVLNDHWITSLPFIAILRTAFNIHQSLIIVVLLNFMLASLLMYWALRKLKVNQVISCLGGLVFAFTPYLSHRIIGHYTYTNIFLFPLIFLILYSFFTKNKKGVKIILALIFSIVLVFCLLTNFYYFLSIILAIIFYVIFSIGASKQKWWFFIRSNSGYFILFLLTTVIFLTPWALTVKHLFLVEELGKVSGFNGALTLSADVISFFVPSEYNFFYRKVIALPTNINPFLMKIKHYYFYNWYGFAYPGILVLFSYLGIWLVKKKKPAIWLKIKPFFWTGLCFALLALGPLLKIFNRWYVTLDDKINVYFPLPFLLLQKLPGFNIIRAPTRFIPIFVFFGVLIGALLLNSLWKKITKKSQIILSILLTIIFIIDQSYSIPSRPKQEIPRQAYEYIKNSKPKGTVLEIPFTVRDGLQYLGSVHSTSFMQSPLYHQHPVIGGYLSRIDPSVFSYYQHLPLISYITHIIDKGNYVIGKEEAREPVIIPIANELTQLIKETEFLDLQYILLKNNEKYSSVIKDLIISLGYSLILIDGSYELWNKTIPEKGFCQIDFGTNNDYLYIARNFGIKEEGFRWSTGKTAQIFIKADGDCRSAKQIVINSASFFQTQEVELWLNKKFVGKQIFDTQTKTYIFEIKDGELQPGINTLTFRFNHAWQPYKIVEGSTDIRFLSVQFFSLTLE